MTKVQREAKIVGEVAWGTGYKSNGMLFISSSEVILETNTVVFQVSFGSKPP
jgi:hypothetical protein